MTEALLSQLRSKFSVLLASNILTTPSTTVAQGLEVLKIARESQQPFVSLYYSFFSRFSRAANATQLRQEIQHAVQNGFTYATKYTTKEDPGFRGSWNNFLVTNLLEKGDTEQAWEELKTIKAQGEDVFAYTYTVLLQAPGPLDRKLRIWRDVDVTPSSVLGLFSLALACIKERKYETALEILRKLRQGSVKPHVGMDKDYVPIVEELLKDEDVKSVEVVGELVSLGTTNVKDLASYFENWPIEKCDVMKRIVEERNETVPPALLFNMIRSYYLDGRAQKALELWKEMREKRVHLNANMYSYLMETFAEQGDLKHCVEAMNEMQSMGHMTNVHAYNALCTVYAKVGNMRKCKETLQFMKRAGNPLVKAFYNIYTSLGKLGNMDAIEEIVELQKSMGVKRESFHHSALLTAYGNAGNLGKCAEIKRHMDKFHQNNIVTYGILLNAYGNAGDLRKCDELMKEMVQQHHMTPNTYIFAALFESFGKAKKLDRCEGWFKNMLQFGIQPDDRVLAPLKKYMGEEWVQKNVTKT